MKKNLIISTALVLALSTSQLVFATDATTSASEAWVAPAATAPAKPAPAKATPAPVKATPAPVKATPAPVKPAVEAPKPAVEAPNPAVEAPKPAVEAPKPAVEAPKLAVEAPKPAVEAPKPAVQAGETYTVVAGDSLAKIAKRFGTTYQELAKLNSLKNPNLILINQVLVVKPVVDVVTAPSIKESSDPAKIAKGLSADGTWIFAVLSDVKLADPLKVDGFYYSKDDPKAKEFPASSVYRKLALYAQDADHNVTANYTLTVPKINVTSPNFRIQNGKVVGDIYVNAVGFELSGTTVEGNVYFASQSQMDYAKLEKGKVTGKVAVQAVDGVTAASEKEGADAAKLVKGVSKDGGWIYSITKNVTMDKELVVEGTFRSKGLAENDVYRKLALYSQSKDRDAKNQVTENFTLTVPKMTVNSPNFRIQNGIVKGDIYVNATGFELAGAKVDGNVYFATESQLESAKLEAVKEVTGKVEVKAFVDGVSAASEKEGNTAADVQKGLATTGGWIYALTNNVTLTDTLNVDGTFNSKGDPTAAVYRKLALYAQDKDRVVTANYTLTAPKGITVTSPNMNFVNGKVVGDVTVNADGFVLNNCTIQGNLTFATEAQKASAVLDKGVVTGGAITVAK